MIQHLVLGLLASLLVAVLGARVWRDYSARRALLDWLDSERGGELPDGHGRWRDIFAALERREKSIRRHDEAQQTIIDRYRRATSVMPDGVVLLDGSDHIEWINAAAAHHLGIDIDRDLGTLIWQLVRQPAFQDYLLRFRAGEATDTEGLTLTAPDNSRTLTVRLFRFSDQGTLLMTRDVSESVRIDRMRRDFVANVSHELRTPATVIYGFLEQLTGDDPPHGEDAQRFLRLMTDQATRMNRLVDDLLTLSRLENSPKPPEDEDIALGELLTTLVAEGRALSAGRHEIELDCPDAITVRGSGDELRSAFGNLVSNAIRYTPEGGRIVLRGYRVNEQAEVCVEDSGIGIAAEHLPRLTERFYRVDRGRSTATGGTGLGLAIVKHVLTRHQATLSIHSELGRGSRFCIRLPKQRLVQGVTTILSSADKDIAVAA
jgi:two-component system phosphate regulon sensor histidine kinase PhoR